MTDTDTVLDTLSKDMIAKHFAVWTLAAEHPRVYTDEISRSLALVLNAGTEALDEIDRLKAEVERLRNLLVQIGGLAYDFAEDKS